MGTYRQAAPGVPVHDGPVSVEVRAYFAMPASWPKWKRELGEREHTSKPDSDNVSKLVLDALNHVAWRDDAGWSDSEGGEIQEAVLERAFRPPGAAPRIDLFGDSSQTDIDGAVADYILRAGHNVVPFDFVP